MVTGERLKAVLLPGQRFRKIPKTKKETDRKDQERQEYCNGWQVMSHRYEVPSHLRVTVVRHIFRKEVSNWQPDENAKEGRSY